MKPRLLFILTLTILAAQCPFLAATPPSLALPCELALLGLQERAPRNADQAIRLYRSIIAEVTSVPGKEHSPEFDNRWSCSKGSCIGLSYQLFKVLRQMGLPVKRIVAKNDRPIKIPNTPSGAFHYFLIDNSTIPGVEIIIDPTYKQFFNQPNSDPDIFIGTREDLEAVYTLRRDQIFADIIPLTARYHPVNTCQINYGYGVGAKTSVGGTVRAEVHH